MLDGDRVIAEDKSNNSLCKYYWGAGNIIARYGASTLSYYFYNGHGDVTERFSATTGNRLYDAYTYDAFGNQKSTNSNDVNPFRYCGEYWDKESGSYYLRARYYDPSIGRFTQGDIHWSPENCIYGDEPQQIGEYQDALGVSRYAYAPQPLSVKQSQNLYVYCVNSPIIFKDYSGELVWPGEIHTQVVFHIAQKHGLYVEQQILYSNGFWGRADLVSPLGEIWEVKRDKPYQIAKGKIQVEKYVANRWKNNPKPTEIILSKGGEIESGSFIYQSEFSTYYVSFRYAGDGVIAYDYYSVTNWQVIGEVAAGIVTIAGITYLLVCTGGAAAPVLVPIILEVEELLQ